MFTRVHSNRISLSLVFMLLTILVTLTVSSCSSEIVEVPVDKIVEKEVLKVVEREVPVEVIKEVEVIREVAVGQQIIKEAVKGTPQLPDVYTDSNGGITVSGSATISVEPDLAILDMGVEAFGKTVSFARSDAAIAMDAIVSSLKSEGVLEKDIQTQRLNISPKYEWEEISIGSQVTNKQVLTGYSVSNYVRVKIRDLDHVGKIVDSASESGGDFVRVNGISFNLEDTYNLMPQLREQAVQNAFMKADEYASAAGLRLGSITSLSEVGSSSPSSAIGNQMRAMSALIESPISGGELQVSLTVLAVFGID